MQLLPFPKNAQAGGQTTRSVSWRRFSIARDAMHTSRPNFCWWWVIATTLVGCILICAPVARAQVTLDGTLGPASALAGPDYLISDDLGQLRGANLFHSFGEFTIDTGESATFTGPASVDNILGRVTGGDASFIDGRLSSQIPDANLYLMNPSGMMFGPNASLDVSGSFHATTADYIRLADGVRFNAAMPRSKVLSSAPPEAFGFLRENPSAITVQGSLATPERKSLSLVSGGVQVNAGTLSAPNGRIDIASVVTAGEVVPGNDDLNVESIDRFGEINVSNGGLIATTGEGGGTIFVRGGELVLSGGSGIEADTQGSEDSGGIDVKAESVILTGSGTFISANTFGEGDGGKLSVEASSVNIAGAESNAGLFTGAGPGSSGSAGDIVINTENLKMQNGIINTQSFPGVGGNGGDITINSATVDMDDSRIDSSTGGSGDAGNITLDVANLEIRRGSDLFAGTWGEGTAGKGGNILINNAEYMLLTGDDQTEDFALISAATFSSGNAGNLTINTENLDMRTAQISVSTFGEGQGGILSVDANRVFLSGSGDGSAFVTGIFNSAGSDATGNAGEIRIKAGSLELRNGAQISVSSSGSGDGGNALIEADTVFLSKEGEVFPSGIFAHAGGSGNGGNLTIKTGRLDLRNGAQISGSVFSDGDAGIMFLEADSIFLSNEDADNVTGIFTQAHDGSGDAGNLIIKADSLEIRNGARVSTTTFTEGQGGEVLIETDNLFISDDGTDVTGIYTQTQGRGNAGNLTMRVSNLEIQGGGQINAATFSQGLGGNLLLESDSVLIVGNGETFSAFITVEASTGSDSTAGDLTIKTDSLELRRGAVISASSDSGQGGELLVEADRVHLSGEGGEFTGIITNAGTGNTVKGGNITINTRSLEVIKEAAISSGTFGVAQGGEIFITADDIILREGGRIRARSTATDLDISNDPNIGRSGNIFINARDSLTLFDDSDISVETAQANAGSIMLQAGDLLHLRDGSAITTSVAEGKGNGGNIALKAVFVVLDGGSAVIANAQEGAGGNIGIQITGDGAFLKSSDSIVSASSEFGIDGDVVISSPEGTVIVGVEALPESFLDASSLLSKRCAARTEGKVGSFVVLGRGGTYPGPDAPLSAAYGDIYTQTEASLASSMTDRDRAEQRLVVASEGQQFRSGVQFVNSMIPARLLFSCRD